MRGRVLFFALTAVAAVVGPGLGPFRVENATVYDSTNTPVVFRGIGLSCTEYMARPGFPAPPPESGFEPRHRAPPIAPESWPGSFAWSCFGGRPAPNASLQLNNETVNIMKYLLPDTAGGAFVTEPRVTKVAWPAPYDEVVSAASPRVVPIVRIPLTAGTWLYDIDANDLLSAGYRTIIDLLVTNFTSQGVAVILDMHASCGGGKIGCKMSGPMALRNFGNYSGALAFWANVSAQYATNSMVFFEAYNEPHVWYQALYGGDQWYAGYSEMYDVVRAHAPDSLVIIGGTGWSYDAVGPLAIWQQYKKEHNGTALRNVLYNLHVYQGMFQGIWNSLRSVLRMVLALKTIGPVIFTEMGQYCCNAGPAVPCNNKTKPCNDHEHGDWFVLNVVNLAAQMDVSWTGWAWRGTNPNSLPCQQGETECGYPDLRGPDGLLTNGSSGGANWASVWATYIASPTITVRDDGKNDPASLNASTYEVPGFLPKPCIIPFFGQGGNCGWPLGTNVSTLPWVSLWNQSLSESVLPGLPPSGPPSSCVDQACAGYTCSETNPVIPEPHPCQ